MSVSPQWLLTQTSPNIRSASVDVGRQPNLNFGDGFIVTSDTNNYQNTITMGVITSSVGAWGQLVTANNNTAGQNLGAPTTFTVIQQWLTSSLTSPAVTAVPTGSIGINVQGMYLVTAAMSFSGSIGTYTFLMYKNNVPDYDAQLQMTIPNVGGQAFPVSLTLQDLDYYTIPTSLDIRVKCSNAGANFQMSNGSFIVVRQVG